MAVGFEDSGRGSCPARGRDPPTRLRLPSRLRHRPTRGAARPASARDPSGMMIMRRLAGALFAVVTLATACTHTPHLMELQGMASGQGIERTYYIAADVVAWDYTPNGSNSVT